MTRRVASVATIINHKGWAFDGVHNSYTVALVVWRSPCSPASTPANGPSTESTDATRSALSPSAAPTPAKTPGVSLDAGGDVAAGQQPCVAIYPGPARSQEHFDAIKADGPEHVTLSTFRGWSNTAAFPQIPTKAAFKVWDKIKTHPRFDEAPPPGESNNHRWRFRPVQGDLNASTDRHRFLETMDVPPSRELDATHDRHRFMNDDGEAAQNAAAGSGSSSRRPPPPPTASTGSETTARPPSGATKASGPSTTASPSICGSPTPATTTTPVRPTP